MNTVQQSALICPASCESSGIWQQFKKPTGWLGWCIGQLMALKNRDLNLWVIELLQIKPNHRILEMGFGSGSSIHRISQIATQGWVAGIDHSPAMVQQASRRNRERIWTQQVELKLGIASDLPFESEVFDTVFCVNTAQFWTDPLLVLAEILRVLKPGGRVAIAIQPRIPNATEEIADQTGQYLEKVLSTAGFLDLHLETKPLNPVSAVCILGSKP